MIAGLIALLVGGVATPIAVPFAQSDNLILVDVAVNAATPVRFILDSGAGITVLNRARAIDLGLDLIERGEIGNFGIGEGRTKIAIARNVSLSLGGLRLPLKTAIVLPFDEQEAMIGQPIGGAIGYEIFERFVVEIDFGAGVVRFHEPKSYDASGAGEPLPLTIKNNIPLTRARLAVAESEPIQADVLLDTGNAGTLMVSSPFVTKHHLARDSVRVASVHGGIGGRFRVAFGRIPSLALGATVVDDVPALLSLAARGGTSSNDYAGNIGGAILNRYRVTFDYSRRRVWLAPLPQSGAPVKEDLSGAVLAAEGRDFQRITVRQVFDRTPACDGGLREGDVIVSIDGTAVRNLAEARQQFRTPNQEYHLIVQRGAETVPASIRTRRWF